MKINKIQIQNFRKYIEANFSFLGEKNIILGPNACGKTTILEAIYFLSYCKSPRTVDSENLIRYNQGNFFISASILKGDSPTIISIGVSKKAKKAKKNGQYVKKLSDFAKEFSCVYFQPNELHSFLGYSLNRRSMIDQVIFKVYGNYPSLLNEYNKLLKQKGVLLQKGSLSYNERELLKVYNDSLAKICNRITLIRTRAIDDLNSILDNGTISLSKTENVFIKYIPSSVDYEKDLNELFDQEINLKQPVVGPHKDDIEVLINGESIKKFGSLGQQKSALLSIKIAFCEWIKKYTQEYPTLLLDDALGELDSDRQNRLFEIINNDIQTIITTTNLNEIKEDIRKSANIIELDKGE